MAFLSFLKTILAPALFALAIYLLLTFAILPVYRSHRARYSQYLPLEQLSPRNPDSFTSRLFAWISLPSTWWQNHRNRIATQHATDDYDNNSLFGEEEGEGMIGFDIDEARRTEQGRLATARGRMPNTNTSIHSDRRLSRELEEGFRDDSDDEGSQAGNTERRGGREP